MFPPLSCYDIYRDQVFLPFLISAAGFAESFADKPTAVAYSGSSNGIPDSLFADESGICHMFWKKGSIINVGVRRMSLAPKL